mmetsp:Transcript_38497/g.95600  ORF Transcript_38497/g.95600 Transcript_38497/m.95600 type:complete len:276 (+) Transcript_38497:1303-2130(+)
MTASAHSTSSRHGHASSSSVSCPPSARTMASRSSAHSSNSLSSMYKVGLPWRYAVRRSLFQRRGYPSRISSTSGNMSIHGPHRLPPASLTARRPRCTSRSCSSFRISARHSDRERHAAPTSGQSRASSDVNMAARGTRTNTSPAVTPLEEETAASILSILVDVLEDVRVAFATPPYPRSAPSHRTSTPHESKPSCVLIHDSSAAPALLRLLSASSPSTPATSTTGGSIGTRRRRGGFGVAPPPRLAPRRDAPVAVGQHARAVRAVIACIIAHEGR